MLTAVDQILSNIRKVKNYTIIVMISVALAASACFIHPAAPIGIVIGFWALVLTIRHPFVLLTIFVVFLIGRLAEFVPILGKLQMGKLLSFAALGVFIISKVQNRDFTFVRSPFLKWFLLFSGAILLSSITGTWPSGSIDTFLADFIKTIILVLLVVNCITTKRQIIIFQISIAVVCSFIGGYAQLASLLGHDPLTGRELVEGSRASLVGMLGDPNDTALVILLSTPFLLLAVIESKPKIKIPFAVLFLMSFIGIISTQSRGGLLGLAASFGLVLNKYIKNKVILLAIIVGFLASMTVVANISERQSGGSHEKGIDASSQGRLDAWVSALHMLVKKPLTGVGFEQFPANFQTYAIDPLEPQSRATHNAYLQVASENGLIGLIPFLIILFLSIKGTLAIYHTVDVHPNKSNLSDIVQMGLLPNSVAVLVPAFFLSVGYSSILFVQFSFIAACVTVLNLKQK
jgi:O-antigen ligase